MDVTDIAAALALWPQTANCTARLINHSENHTFRIDRHGVPAFCLRVHRPGYQSRRSIESELSWLTALRRDVGIPAPAPVAGSNGQHLQEIWSAAGDCRLAVLFPFATGQEPRPDDDLEPLFRTLGSVAARMHEHAEQWTPPAGFERQVWSGAHILDAAGLWGDWRQAPGVDTPTRALLDRLDTELRRRLAEYGTAADRFGLIHADMRLGNLLVDGDAVTLIDFDDCGFCWFAYDFAAAISFHETHAAVPALRAAWLAGYQANRPFGADDIAALETMVLLRRMALLAWIGSHGETGLAQQHANGFAAGTAMLAERYLGGALWR
ncbi:phosphotransferase enzyme family protein [Devosia limi]|uniref:Ser/Thr protein kinase RdoA involved in Cpx stress response, MazF antagonist n=1 Tax=Devosia limi DSM 17137 TaxID=1121477 RepID=A0A1M5ED48_9HYPH|nr:phosphotransferase [Devosia limi]SHF77022.1 Ser/Thr protein kinase RdoA involved in Cpx stress response, MazF antagonist [Devosia limi DSM 17137]